MATALLQGQPTRTGNAIPPTGERSASMHTSFREKCSWQQRRNGVFVIYWVRDLDTVSRREVLYVERREGYPRNEPTL